MSTGSLAGKTALVTGASRNIGRAIALKLAGAGADIVVNTLSDRDAAEGVAREIRTLGRKALVQVADIVDRTAVDRMVAQAREELGPIDILVNCPAPRTEVAFEEMPNEQWRDMLAVVLDGRDARGHAAADCARRPRRESPRSGLAPLACE